jgi:drug/metabolite transporter (DMT)-like permease
MKESARTVEYDLLLLTTAAIWGFAFVAQRVGMRYLGPFTFNGVRFMLGSLVLVPIWRARDRRRKEGAGAYLLPALIAGGILFSGASLQQIGIIYTTAGKCGFITGLYVVLVPLLGLIWGQRPGPARWVGVLLAVTGLFLLGGARGLVLGKGDFLVFLSSFFWAGHVLFLGWASPRLSPVKLASLQYLVVSVLSLAVSFAVESPRVGAMIDGAVPLLYGGLMSVGVAYTLQVVAQKKAAPSHTAILLSLEGAFAALGGWLILGETLSPRELTGCGLMLAAMILSSASSARPRR